MGRPKGSKNGIQSLVDNICSVCGCTFQTYPSQRRTYCSVKCWDVTRGKKIQRTCATCGKEFDAYESDIERKPNSGTYCSKECMSAGRLISCSCGYCGNEFDTALSRVNGGRGKYCSRECQSKAIHEAFEATKIVRVCLVCGKEFRVNPNDPRAPQYCSRKCGKTGELNPQWIGGHTIEYPPEWTRKLRNAIKRRDGYRCRLCGEHATDVHHIDYNKDNCAPENLISLCHSCHAKTNTRRGDWMELFKRLGTGQVDHQHVTEIIDWLRKGMRA